MVFLLSKVRFEARGMRPWPPKPWRSRQHETGRIPALALVTRQAFSFLAALEVIRRLRLRMVLPNGRRGAILSRPREWAQQDCAPTIIQGFSDSFECHSAWRGQGILQPRGHGFERWYLVSTAIASCPSGVMLRAVIVR